MIRRIHMAGYAPGLALCASYSALKLRGRLTSDLALVTCENCRRRKRNLEAFLARNRAS